jgi:Ni/Fe-hydrogenase 1 B-type cytochrome subunit
MTTTAVTFDRLYIWERPVRLYHWVTALSLAVLVATGLLIGRPPAFLTTADASATRWFGLVRLVHFAAGFAFMGVFLLRMYWLIAGNRYANWTNFFPLTRRLLAKQTREAIDVIKVDFLQLQKAPLEIRGHNALAAWSYQAVFAATAFEVVTGLALYAPMSSWWFPQLFVWVTPLMGGDASVRFWHHAVTWFFVAFTVIHVYLCIYHDYVEAHGEISSMISGSKFVPRDEP